MYHVTPQNPCPAGCRGVAWGKGASVSGMCPRAEPLPWGGCGLRRPQARPRGKHVLGGQSRRNSAPGRSQTQKEGLPEKGGRSTDRAWGPLTGAVRGEDGESM